MTDHRSYGWRRGLPDHRDLLHLSPMLATKLPSKVDMRAKCPAVYDQGSLGSCTANALGGAHEFLMMRQLEKAFVPSRLFIYYEERAREDSIPYDAGAVIRDGAKVMAHVGCPPETLWPYAEARFATRPKAAAYKEALKHRITSYATVPQGHDAIRATLAEGLPIVFGFSVYESFESQATADSGWVLMPEAGEAQLGGHAVLLVGYDDTTSTYLVRNSWGDGWGDKGYFHMPYRYVESADLASDFWVLRTVQ